MGQRTLAIVLRRVGHLVTGYKREGGRSELAIIILLNPENWRVVVLKMVKPGGGQVDIELLRSLDWIEDYGAHVDGSVFLDMKHMSAEGMAEILAIEPCPPLEEGEGRLVTGTFRHTSGEVYDLKLESESKPLGVTATHPFWSEDRNAWVSAIDLEVGETLKTLEGTTVVESRSKREKPETVYNIEVEGDHCYRVGESGVLVHNASPGVGTEIAYGSSDLSQKAQAKRREDQVFSLRNVAVFEYQDDSGSLQTIAMISRSNLQFTGDTGHAERLIDAELRSRGIDPCRVTRIYSELEPCDLLPGAHCRTMIARDYPQAQVTYSFEYGDAESRRRGKDALRAALDQLDQ